MSKSISHELLPPDPSLLAILLVVKLDSRAQLVFHYPPQPGEDNSHFRRYLAQQQQDGHESSSSSDSTSSYDEQPSTISKSQGSKTGNDTPELDVDETGSASPKKGEILNSQHGKPRWDDIFGLPSRFLVPLLCPPPSAHKRKVEVTIDDKVFVGRPVYARDGEHWRRRRRKGSSEISNGRADVGGERGTVSKEEKLVLNQAIGDSTESSEQATQDERTTSIRQNNPSITRQETDKNIDSTLQSNLSAERKVILNMFNVVFVMNPPPHEYQQRISDMYDNVIKKFSKALKWEQARSNYLLKEVLALLGHSHDKSFRGKAPGDDTSLY